MKTCKICEKEITADDVYEDHPRVCKQCHCERSAKYRKTPNGRAAIKRISRIRYIKFRDKCIARAKLRAAVNAGKLIKQSYCSACLNEGEIHGHHTDYTKPLEVTWLCQRCHLALHKEDRVASTKNRKQVTI